MALSRPKWRVSATTQNQHSRSHIIPTKCLVQTAGITLSLSYSLTYTPERNKLLPEDWSGLLLHQAACGRSNFSSSSIHHFTLVNCAPIRVKNSYSSLLHIIQFFRLHSEELKTWLSVVTNFTFQIHLLCLKTHWSSISFFVGKTVPTIISGHFPSHQTLWSVSINAVF